MVIRYAQAPSARQLQTAQTIRGAIAEILIRGELAHPFFEKIMITVSEVRISRDLKLATAFLIFPTNSDKQKLLKLFNEISPQIRRLIASKINMRFSPEIRFVIDETSDNAKKIDDLLNKI